MRARVPSGIALPVLVMSAGCASPTWTPVPMSTLPAAPPAAAATQAPARRDPAPQATPAPTAIDGALPAGLDVVLQVHETCSRVCSPAAGRAYPDGVARSNAAPAGVWSQVLAKAGVTLTIPRDAQVDLLGVVVHGEATVRSLEAREELPLAAWGALRAAGAGVVLTARQPDTRLVLAVVTDGKAVSELGTPIAWKTRPAPLETRDLAKSDDLAWAGGAMHARLGFETGRASLGLLLASRDAGVARHRHDDAWEVLVALRADGAFELASPEASRHLGSGMVAAVPRGTAHAWKPAGTDPLVAVQLYVPPGPEQRFRALAKRP